nr:metal ABC transporter permease [Solirubrobacterales bacterium]
MAATLIDPLTHGVTQRAIADLAILGAVCGPLGVWVVLHRQSYAAESLAHSMLPGLVLAALIGAPLGLGAAAGLAVAVALIALASRGSAVGPDVAVAVTVTALFGLGTLLALSPEVPLRIGELLFGDPLSVSGGDLAASGALAFLVAGGLALGARSLALAGFDPQSAPSLGSSPRRASAVLLALLALTTLVAVQALGNLLVVAIVIAPAAAALRLQSRLLPSLFTASGLAIACGIAGIYLSYYADLAAGASVALCAVGLYALTLPMGSP